MYDHTRLEQNTTKKANEKASGQNPGSLENREFFGVGDGTCFKNLTTEIDVH